MTPVPRIACTAPLIKHLLRVVVHETRRIMRISTTLLALSFAISASSAGGATFERVFGGAALDHAASVEQTEDGGYILLGQAPSLGADPCLLKTDSLGNMLWVIELETDCAQYSGFTVIQTADGGYMALLSCWCCPRQARILAVKTDPMGKKLWGRACRKTGTEYTWGNAIRQTQDGRYILTGGVGLAPYLAMLSSRGELQWEKTYSFGEETQCRCVAEVKTGGYVAAGGRNDMFLMRTSRDGDLVWARTYGGPELDKAYWVEPAPDGGYVMTGYTESYGAGAKDVYLVKTDADGKTAWARTYGTRFEEIGYSVQTTTGGGYIVVGTTGPVGAEDTDIYLVKTDSIGSPLWTRTYGGARTEKAYSVRQTADGGYVFAGYTASCGSGDFDAYLVKTDSLGLVTGARDAAVLSVNLPTGVLDTGSPCSVIGEIQNRSNKCISYTAVAFIEGVYADTVLVQGHAPGTARQISFDDWIPRETGPTTHTLTIYTDLEGDSDPTNDFAQKQITVR